VRAQEANRRSSTRRRTDVRRWSREVTERSNALDLERDVFKKPSPRAIAESLRRSAERSRRRRADPFRSAMSMLTFYINRAGRISTRRGGGRWSGPSGSSGGCTGARELVHPRVSRSGKSM